jgi:hypothetical protein
MTTIASINNKLQNVLTEYATLVGGVYSRAIAAKTQLRQLTKSRKNLGLDDVVQGIKVIGFNTDDNGEEIAVGRLTTDVPVFGPLLKTNYGSALLASSGDFLFDITVPMTTQDVFDLFTVELKSYFSAVMTEQQIILAAISVSEGVADFNATPGFSKATLINQAGQSLLDLSSDLLARLPKNKSYMLDDVVSKSDLANNIVPTALTNEAPRNQVPIINFTKHNPRISLRTVEEIEAYLLTSIRDVTQVIVGHSNTFKDQSVSYDSLFYRDVTVNNLDGVSCHFIITKNGQVVIARDLNTVAPFSDPQHNDYSIAVMFEGGLSTASDSGKVKKSKSSFTKQQFRAFKNFMEAFYNVYPGGQAWGKNDLQMDNTEPEFDVTKFVHNVFDKQNTQTVEQAKSVGSLSTEDLIYSQR